RNEDRDATATAPTPSAAQQREDDDEENEEELRRNAEPARRARVLLRWRGDRRGRVERELEFARIPLGHPRRHQLDRAAVVARLEQRDRLVLNRARGRVGYE